MEIILFWLILSCLVGYYAKTKGRDSVKAFILAIFISPLIGFIVVALLENKSDDLQLKSGDLKKCPACAELIKSDALKCKHCGESQAQDKSVDELQLLIKNLKNK
ncbi:zinc-ribbon domain containing protein [Methylophilaceae bacterium]